MNGKILSETAFTEVVQALPSVHHRANLTVHNVVLMHRIKELETELQKSTPHVVSDVEKQKEEKIKALETEIATLRATSSQSQQTLAERVTELTATVKGLNKSLDDAHSVNANLETQNTNLGAYLAQLEQRLATAQVQPKEIVREVIKEVIKTVPAPSADSDTIRLDERKQIVAWLRLTNVGETVRALYGQKMAKQIESGAYLK